jgi:hypothetical protein
MALLREAPLSTLPTLVVVGTTYEKRPDSGFPTESALASLNSTSDQLIRAVLAVQPGIYVGTYTYAGEQVHYIYTRSAEGVESAFKRELAAQCPDCIPLFRTRSDPQWNAYLKFLYPNQATLEHYGFKPTARSKR